MHIIEIRNLSGNVVCNLGTFISPECAASWLRERNFHQAPDESWNGYGKLRLSKQGQVVAYDSCLC